MANRLAEETSPYLLQHATTRSTGIPGARRRSRGPASEDKPILLSVGYSACHWCHVMERESFEDAETAAYMNEHFVNIKVDREERPDLDAIYMEAVQAMTGHGGWPMTVFLDPDGVPFYGGTYFPPDERRGMPGFRMVLEAVRRRLRAPTRGDPRAGAARRASGSARSATVEPRPASAGERGCSTAAAERLLGRRRPRSTAASAARRSSRPPRRSSCCSARGEQPRWSSARSTR